MTQFGAYLKRIREAKGLTQKALAEQLSTLGITVSQARLALYEAGRVADPAPEVLYAIAQVLEQDYMDLVLRLVRQKYAPNGAWSKPGVSHERLELWDAALRQFPKVGEVEDLEEDQLRAKRALVATTEILDVEGSAKWQMKFPSLQNLWILVPNFVDERNPSIRRAILHNMKRNVEHVYFVKEEDAKDGGRFWALQQQLAAIDPDVTRDTVERLILPVPLKEEQLRFFHTDAVIANPLHVGGAVGFAVIRREGAPVFSIRMSPSDVDDAVGRLRPVVLKALGADKLTPAVIHDYDGYVS